MPNRLANSTSPYLLQHSDNPVDWWEWGPAAFDEARRRDVPVLLSVGYSACHWCHVMAHESFEDAATAAVMNAGYVNVKVDREERPDVDAVYMAATQALTGRGGWPMTVFLDHEGRPFYAGTYFPPTPRHGTPSFGQLLQAITETWTSRRDEVTDAGSRITGALHRQVVEVPPDAAAPTREDLDEAADALARAYDQRAGGFGDAPKFPPSMALEFLLRQQALRLLDARGRDPRIDLMVAGTCDAMARGGMYDQLAGGFARYSVDADWVVPHFEKMLYDNALLLDVYLSWWLSSGSDLALRVVHETARFLLDDLRTPQGAFASALDADSEGEEGRAYVWTPAQLVHVLGEDDGAWVAAMAEVSEAGTFEHGTSVLQRRQEPDDLDRWERCRQALLVARRQRVQPGRDDKVVAAWNGLAIAALARAGRVLDEPAYVTAAEAAADLILRVHFGAGDGPGCGPDRVVRVSRDGRAGAHAGVLEDQAAVAIGLLALHQATADAGRLDQARVLVDAVLRWFVDEGGACHDTAADAESLVLRPSDLTDNATPSGRSLAAEALLTFAALSGEVSYADAADGLLRGLGALGRRHARFLGRGLAVAAARLDGPREVAVVGESGTASYEGLLAVTRRATAPGVVVVGGTADAAPLLHNRSAALDGAALAYVCRGFVCDAPTEDPMLLGVALSGKG